jgi:hypothetical protein
LIFFRITGKFIAVRALVAGIVFCLICSQVESALVYDGTAANLVAPIDDPGWNSIGQFTTQVGSAVFLGNHGGAAWFLTANHVPTSGNTLQIANQSFTQFFAAQQIGTADLKVFRLNTELIGLTPVTLATSQPTVGASVVMMGYGRTGTKVTWDLTTNPWTEGGSGAEGYTWSGPNVMRWGTNEVHQRNISSGGTIYFTTDFDAVAGQAQGSLGDSGGAVFIKNGGNWELAGIMLAVGVLDNGIYLNSFTGQPGSTSVASITGAPNNKSVTFNAQIATYEAAIQAAIPEPSSLSLVLLSLLGLWGRKTRKAGPVRW